MYIYIYVYIYTVFVYTYRLLLGTKINSASVCSLVMGW